MSDRAQTVARFGFKIVPDSYARQGCFFDVCHDIFLVKVLRRVMRLRDSCWSTPGEVNSYFDFACRFGFIISARISATMKCYEK